MAFNPGQIAALTANVDQVVAVQDIPDSLRHMNTPWPTLQSIDVKHFNERVAHELNASAQFTASIGRSRRADA